MCLLPCSFIQLQTNCHEFSGSMRSLVRQEQTAVHASSVLIPRGIEERRLIFVLDDEETEVAAYTDVWRGKPFHTAPHVPGQVRLVADDPEIRDVRIGEQ